MHGDRSDGQRGGEYDKRELKTEAGVVGSEFARLVDHNVAPDGNDSKGRLDHHAS